MREIHPAVTGERMPAAVIAYTGYELALAESMSPGTRFEENTQ